MFNSVKRLLVGRPLESGRLGETLLPKWLALPVFCSDPISSVAYATEEIVLVLAAGGLAYLSMAKWVAAVVAALLVVVVASYRQTCHAYPNGGGAYVVSKDNLGESAALTAASALLVDYVMTVAVSVVSGVVAITSAIPSLQAHAVLLSVGFVAVLAIANLRGVKESGRIFAFPTYTFIVLTFLMFAFALIKGAFGHLPDASTAGQQLQRTAHVGGVFTLLLALRAFASGCTALTGVEAISNGVPSFRKPKSDNAAATLAIMGGLAVAMFSGITVLAVTLKARAQPSGNPSVISQIAASVFGGHAFLFYAFQAATAGILILAANTAFNGFPTLASILARDSYLPRQLHNRGDRLVYSNGILLLAGFSVALIIGFNANIDRLIQLYIIGVFTSFTLSQLGMVRHWSRELGSPDTAAAARPRIRRAQTINTTGAIATALVLVVVLYTKVAHGAWLAILAMLVLFALMRAISRYYGRVAQELIPEEEGRPALPANVHAVVLISKMHKPALRALSFAAATRPSTLEALTVTVDAEETLALRDDWDRRGIPMPLRIMESPYRDVTRSVLDYVHEIKLKTPRDVVAVFVPEYVVNRWWQNLLHNQSALRLKARLLFMPDVMVVNVPYLLRGAAAPDGFVTRPEIRTLGAEPAGAPLREAAPAGAPTREAAPAGADGGAPRHGHGRGRTAAPGPVPPPQTPPIAAVVPGTSTDVQGRVRSVQLSSLADSPVFTCEVADSSGVITAQFYGRREIAGIKPGVTIRLHGRPSDRTGKLVVANPRYELIADDRHDG